MWVVICLFPYMQQYYAYMYLALGLNTGKPDCLFTPSICKKNTNRFCGRVFHGHDFVNFLKSHVKMKSTRSCSKTSNLKTQIFISTGSFDFSPWLHLKLSVYFVVL